MKAVGKLQIIWEPNTLVAIDPQVASTAKLQSQSILDAVVLLPNGGDAAHNDDPNSRVTLIATPLPESSWGKLVRFSATLAPKPGSLRRMIEVLNDLHLRCRYVETVNDIDLQGRRLFGLDFSEHDLNNDSSTTNLLIPSTMTVIEVPETPDGLGLGNDEVELHRLLALLAQESINEQDKASLLPLLQDILRKKNGEIEVDWISPMATLNRLQRRLTPSPDKDIRRFSQRLVVEAGAQEGLRLDLLPFQRILWDKNILQTPPSYRTPASMFVKAFADSAEKVICWDFYLLSNDLVVEFDLKTPTGGREHIWWHWIYECIAEAKGNILASATYPRVAGEWATLHTTVVFPLREGARSGENGDIATIVNCFRKLQGNTGNTKHFDDLKNRLAGMPLNEKPVPPEIGKKSTDEYEHQSLLQNVEVWDSSDLANSRVRPFFERFAPNPFNFTSPLDLALYRQLYGNDAAKYDARLTLTQDQTESPHSRRRLAERIIQKLSGNPGENIAIVGAHRAGKTTVLNLVYDILKEKEGDAASLGAKKGDITLIPVRINAAIAPPHMFLPAIVEELEKLANTDDGTSNRRDQNSRRLAQSASEILQRMKPLLPLIAPFISALEVGLGDWHGYSLALGLEWIKNVLRDRKNTKKPQQSEEKINLQDPVTANAFLRHSLTILRDALEDKGNFQKVHLLIIVDEFSQSSNWGIIQALPLWRYVIESREFSRIKWLISTSRPIKDVSDYSPITNVLHEFNVGPLPLEESERLIDAFSYASWTQRKLPNLNDDKKDKKPFSADDEFLHPVVMQQARMFLLETTSRLAYLLQVVCYHIYDRATRTYIPLVGRSLSVDVICDYVLPELSDFLEHQWSQVREDGRTRILESLQDFSSQKEFLRNLNRWRDDVQSLPQAVRKALERSGLRGDDSHSVAPLVACWLLPPEPRGLRNHQFSHLEQVPG